MSFSLTANFLANARGITFEDTASVTWAFNANTNEIEATATGAGEVSTISFGTTGLTPSSPTGGAIVVAGTLAIGSGGTGQTTAAAAFAALSPLTTEGDIIYETAAPAPGRLPIGAANTALVSNGSVPVWAAIVNSVAAGTGITVSAATGAVTIGCSITQSSGANPTGKVGLTETNGSAATFMRSDGAPEIDQTIAPTWTGDHTFTPASGVGITVNGNTSAAAGLQVNAGANQWCAWLVGSSASGQSYGPVINAGTTSADYALFVQNYNASIASGTTYFAIRGDGAIAFHGATPQAQSTGYGTPTAATKTTNFPGTAATLAECGGMLSTLILYFKALGLLGA